MKIKIHDSQVIERIKLHIQRFKDYTDSHPKVKVAYATLIILVYFAGLFLLGQFATVMVGWYFGNLFQWVIFFPAGIFGAIVLIDRFRPSTPNFLKRFYKVSRTRKILFGLTFVFLMLGSAGGMVQLASGLQQTINPVDRNLVWGTEPEGWDVSWFTSDDGNVYKVLRNPVPQSDGEEGNNALAYEVITGTWVSGTLPDLWTYNDVYMMFSGANNSIGSTNANYYPFSTNLIYGTSLSGSFADVAADDNTFHRVTEEDNGTAYSENFYYTTTANADADDGVPDSNAETDTGGSESNTYTNASANADLDDAVYDTWTENQTDFSNFETIPDYKVTSIPVETEYNLTIDAYITGDSETINVRIWDYNTLGWDVLGALVNDTVTEYALTSADHVKSGEANMSFIDTSNDAIVTSLFVDFVRIDGHTDAVPYQFSPLPDYQVDGAADETFHFLEIDYAVSGDAELIDVEIYNWTATAWFDAGDISSGTSTPFNYTISVANGLLNGTRGADVRFNDQDADASQTTLNIDYVRIHAYTPAQTDYTLATASGTHYPDYQVTGLPVGFDWYELQVEYRTTNLPSENIYIQVFDDPSNTTRGTITIDETAVFEYNLTANERLGNDVIIRFVDSDQATDSTQTTIEIDYVRVYAYQAATYTEDPVDNEASNVDGVADRGTLTNFANMQTFGVTYATITESNYGGDGTNIEDFIDNDTSDVGAPTDLGSLTNFANMQNYGTTYATLTESDEGTAAVNNEDAVDQNTTDVDSVADIGTENNFANAQSNPTGTYMDLTEANQGGGGGSEWLNVNGYDSTYTTWQDFIGSSPYLDATDYATNYIHEDKSAGAQAGWFDFANTGLTGSGITVNVSFYCWGDDGNDGFYVYVNYDASHEWQGGSITTPVSAAWMTITLNGTYTATQVNAMKVYLETWNGAAGDDQYVDHGRIGTSQSGADDYEVSFEYNWGALDYDETNEELCIYIAASFPTENLVAQIWESSAWTNLVTISGTGWSNTSITSYLDSTNETIRFIGANEAGESTQDTWNIGYIGVHSWSAAIVNYRLDQEVQFTTISDTDNTNEELCIYTNSTDAENIQVDIWDGSWVNLISDLTANAWTNVSISSYLDAATETIRFVDATQSSDTGQDTWQPNAVLIHTWNADPDWEANQEIQFTTVAFGDDTERFCIYMNATDAEDLGVSVWNGSWYSLWTDLTADSWNNKTVYNTITSDTITLRFLAGTETGDSTQSSWQINIALIQTENASNAQTDYTAEGNAVSDNGVWDSYSESRTARVDSYTYTPEGNAAADDAVTDDYTESGSAVSDTSTYTAEGDAVSDNGVYDQFDEDAPEYDFDYPPKYVIASIPSETTYNVSIDWDDATWGDSEDFNIQMWNFTSSAWVTIAIIDETNSTPWVYVGFDFADLMSSQTVNITFVDTSLDATQTTVKIDQVQVQGHTDAGIKYELSPIPTYEVDGSSGYTNYNMTIEVRWTSAGGEDLNIQMWNFTSSAWETQYSTQTATYAKFNVTIATSNGLMNATYDCRVRVNDNDKTVSDTTQSTADVDFVRIAGWTDAVYDYELSMFYTITISNTNYDWYKLNVSAKRDDGGDNFDMEADGISVGTVSSSSKQYFDVDVSSVATDGTIYFKVNDTISDDDSNQSVYFDWVRVWGHNNTDYDYDFELVFEFDSAQAEGIVTDIAIEDESNSTGGGSIVAQIKNNTATTWHDIWTVSSETETQHTWNTADGDDPADILNTTSGFDMRYLYSDLTSLVNLTIDRLNATITYSVPDEYRLQIELNFTFTPSFGDITAFNITDRSSIGAGTVNLAVKNWTGGEWDNAFSVTEGSETTHTQDMGADSDSYVHANDNITVRYLGAQGSDNYGNLTIDLLQIVIEYTASDSDNPSIVLDSPVNNTWSRCNQVNLTISDVSGVSKAFYKWGSWSEVWGLWNPLTAPWDIDTSGFGDGSYTLWIIANDTVPNPANIFDNNVSYTIKIDNTAPEHGLVTPANNSIVGGTIPWDFDPVDGTGSGIDWMAVDDGVSNTTLTSPLYTNNMDTSGYVEGTKDFTIYLNDTAGIWNITTVRLTIDHSPPFLVSDSPNNLTWIGGNNQLFKWDYDDTYATIDQLWENWEGGSNTTRSDNVAWYEDIDTMYPSVEGDAHWKRIFVNDTSGNDGAANYTYYVDSLAPRIEQLSPANGTTHSGTIWLNASLSETNILLNYTRIWGAGYDQTFNVLNYSLDTTLLGDGWYQWRAYCSDDFGHSNSSTRWIKVDNLNPVPDITAHEYSDPFIYENTRQIITLTVTVSDGDETDIDEVWVYWTTNDWISNNTIIATQGEDSDPETFFAEISGHDAGITCYWFAYVNNTVGDQDDRYPSQNYQSFSWDVEITGGAEGSPILFWFEPDDQGASILFWYFIFILFIIIVLMLYFNRKRKRVVS